MDRFQWYTNPSPWEPAKKDLFISHASEDKDAFVRPLAEALRERGVKVWYDEFELKMGDSLTDSIEKGLSSSRFGLVVLSPVFFEKGWTDFELKSLLMRQINGERVILPIWHNLGANEIRQRMPYLLDIKALSSDAPQDQLIDNILLKVRPDILNSQLMLDLGRTIFKEKKLQPSKQVSIKELRTPPVRHETMPFHLIAAARLISEIFWEVMPMDPNEMVRNFSRDVDYDQEFIVWSAMASAYVNFNRETCNSDQEKRKEAFNLLFRFTLTGQPEQAQALEHFSESDYAKLLQSYIVNFKQLISMVKRYN